MKVQRILLLLLVIGQILISAFGGFNGQSSYSTPIITPAGYAFSIWGLIILGCLVYSLYQLLPSQKKKKLFDQLFAPLAITFSGYIFWIVAAVQDWLWTTVLIFIIMLIGLWKAYTILQHHSKTLSRFESFLLHGTLGVYIGWATAAVPLNISAAMVYYNLIYPDGRGIAAYFLILVGSLGFALWGQWKIGRNFYYTGTILWALVAIVVETIQRGSDTLAIITLLAICIFAYLVYLREEILSAN